MNFTVKFFNILYSSMKYLLLLLVLPSSLFGISITELQDLRFPDQIPGIAATVTVAPSDTGAAQFRVTCDSSTQRVRIRIPTTSVTLSAPGGSSSGYRITADTFTTNYGGTNTSAYCSGGQLTIRVGARITINTNDVEEDFTGSNILRVTSYY